MQEGDFMRNADFISSENCSFETSPLLNFYEFLRRLFLWSELRVKIGHGHKKTYCVTVYLTES